MNYIAEINAFERWLEANYLPAASQLLWYKLMALCNRCGWMDWIVVDNLRLMMMIGATSTKTAIAARDKLIDGGLLEFKKGKKGSPNQYHLISLQCNNYNTNDTVNDIECKNYTENDTINGTINALQMTPQTAHINKHKPNETKQNNNHESLSPTTYRKQHVENSDNEEDDDYEIPKRRILKL